MKQRIIRIAWPLLFVFALTACEGENLFPTAPARAASDLTGAIVGSVTEAGAPVGGVEVVLGLDEVRTTDSQGQYRFEGLAAGPYTLAIRVPPGFILDPGDFAVRNVAVTVGGTETVNWRLQRQDNVGGPPVP